MTEARPVMALLMSLAAAVRQTALITSLLTAIALPILQDAPPKPPPPAPPAPKPLVAMSPDGTRIVYEAMGSGPAMMLLHGGGQTRRSWHDAGYVDRLSKRFTVITVDLRGGGDSDKPETAESYALERLLGDLQSVADAVSAKTFHVWGFGHGATLARYLAARSERVISAVLVSTTMGPPVSGVAKDAMVAMREKWQAMLDAKRAGKLDLKALSPGDRAALEGGMAVNAIALGALVDYPPVEPAEIKVPTLWILASDDAAAVENRKLYEEKLAGSKITLKVLASTNYSDIFFKLDQVFEVAEPFLKPIQGPLISNLEYRRTVVVPTAPSTVSRY
jgi:pimeloyl-ACP methyl ester carboxylesterase